MLVVEISSTGADILFLIVPGAKECLVVKLLCGIGILVAILAGFPAFLVVNALERLVDMLAAGVY